MALPALRYVDISSITHEGKPVFCLRDQEGYVEEALVLSPLALFIATQLDGQSTVEDIQAAFVSQCGGQLLQPDDILRVVTFLDEQGFLLSDRFDALQAETDARFHAAPTRPAHFADKSYPADAESLTAFLNDLYLRPDGPAALPASEPSSPHALPGLVVPHIDFHRGGHTYAHGYRRLSEHARPDVVIVFGVAHASPPSPFIFTRKHFETPLGTVETDIVLVDRLAAVCDFDPFAHESVQRTEHSIEFHAVMLAHLWGSQVKMVPILCGPFFDDSGLLRPDEALHVTRLLDECRAIVAENPGRVTVIASADLAHVGQRFGDAFEIDGDILASVRARDTEDLEKVVNRSAQGWYDSVMRDENARRVCGIHCVYATLKSLEGAVSDASLLSYGYAPDPAGGIVSFASVALFA